MHVKGLDGKEYKLNLTKYHNKQRKNASGLHKQAREILQELYPNHTVFEEVRLLGSKEIGRVKQKELFADFLVPTLGIVVEVHGEQHYEFNTHFHANKLDFYLAKGRDRLKREWCEINSITYIELPYNESAEQWKSRIESR